MARIRTSILRGYLLGRPFVSQGCLRARCGANTFSPRPSLVLKQSLHAAATTQDKSAGSFRAQLKKENKAKKEAAKNASEDIKSAKLRDWELTVGIEIHAVLNTPSKLFSAARASHSSPPNTSVAPFDLAIPGSQPVFQKQTLIPAIRAALALNCDVQEMSTFDRKHYFHWDQPAGYQITQYYRPFAKNGYVKLYARDGIAEEDGDEVTIGIKQVQMEQDTAKTILQGDNQHLLDYNRAGLALIEIISLPQIHHPKTAAALVKKIQLMLNSVDACVMGMELGGLRADVNVSVRRRDAGGSHSYAGVEGLGQRTEIKNLSSFKSVEDAIVAERDRQIAVLEAGGKIAGETRGWSIGSTETRRLRSKEGEVDYRYLPDADIPPLRIGQDLVEHLRETMGTSRDDELDMLVKFYGLTMKDALSLVSLDDGKRVDYFYNVVRQVWVDSPEAEELSQSQRSRAIEKLSQHETSSGGEAFKKVQDLFQSQTKLDIILQDSLGSSASLGFVERILEGSEDPFTEFSSLGRTCGNWVLHELGGLRGVATGEVELFPNSWDCILPAEELASIIRHLMAKEITGNSAKKALALAFEIAQKDPHAVSVKSILTDNNLWHQPMTRQEYRDLALSVLDEQSLAAILKGNKGKVKFLMGQMMRKGDTERLEPQTVQEILDEVIAEEKAKREAK